MAIATVNISFDKRLLKDIDSAAAKESRSRSELIREASRLYIQKMQKWDDIFKYSEKTAQKRGLKESDISAEIRKVRKK